VKIATEAHEKISAPRGVTRNHLLAQYSGYDAERPLESDELLNALVFATLLF
jgi:hypothetical protein